MRKHMRFFARCAVFVCAACICVHLLYQVIVPKYFLDDIWPTTSAYLGFYEMEKDTIDVFFFGSSHVVSAFAPQELYNEYGIRSYNLGCEQQNLITSYFWLKEALRYQHPKTVILDCYMLFPYNKDEPLNTQESRTRKAFDYMKWSSVKKEAVETICELDQNQSLLGYYFPNIRYHTRWKDLSRDDFSFGRMSKHNELKGYAPQPIRFDKEGFTPIETGKTTVEEEMVPLMREYLDKITGLCEEEGISLILVKTPTTLENIEKSNTIQSYAKEHGLQFYDFNEKKLYKETGFWFAQDNKDDEHVNFWGAQKLTNYLGQVLEDEYGISGRGDQQWEDTKAYYEKVRQESELADIEDPDEYLTALQGTDYGVFLSANGNWTEFLKDSTLQKMRELGLQAPIKDTPGCNYLAVISDGELIEEQIGEVELYARGRVGENDVMYEIISGRSVGGIMNSIKLDSREKGMDMQGLNIVVYDLELGKQVDVVCFDTCAEKNSARR